MRLTCWWYRPTLVSQPQDTFLVRLRMETTENPMRPWIVDTCHRHLWDSLWCVHTTEGCLHTAFDAIDTELDEDQKIVSQYDGLMPDIVEDMAFADIFSLTSARILIFPTADHTLGRYHILYWLSRNSEMVGAPVMLRTMDCCVACAVKQATEDQRSWTWCVVT